jgi:hypothetical protein
MLLAGVASGGLSAVLPALGYGLRTVAQQAARESTRQFAGQGKEQQPGSQWHWMVSQGHKVCLCLQQQLPGGTVAPHVQSAFADI